MNETRELILAKVRAALRHREAIGAPPAEEAPSGWGTGAARAPDAGSEALVTRLCERLRAYGADVRRVAAADVGIAVAEACRERAARRVVVPPALPGAWRPAGLGVVEDDCLAARELDALDGVVTGCTLAVAETGTLVLTGAPTEGRRVLTLVPDLHVCVVGEDQVVADLPAAMPALAGLVRGERRPLTFVSGPSATSDIELQRVEGVHGPRRMVVLVVAPA